MPNCQESTYLAQARVFVDVIGIFGMKILSGTRGGGRFSNFGALFPDVRNLGVDFANTVQDLIDALSLCSFTGFQCVLESLEI